MTKSQLAFDRPRGGIVGKSHFWDTASERRAGASLGLGHLGSVIQPCTFLPLSVSLCLAALISLITDCNFHNAGNMVTPSPGASRP